MSTARTRCNPNSATPDSLAEQRVECRKCALFRICLPKNVDSRDLAALDAIIVRRRPADRGQFLFKAGDRFAAIYAVRSGSIKTYRSDERGNEQICGFHLPGELVGLDGIVGDRNTSTAKLLNTSTVCEIPYDRLQALLPQIPQLQQELTRLLSREIVVGQWQLSLLGRRRADERVAALLCNIADRLAQRGYSSSEFTLPMSRADIGNFLGLTVETVSRIFSRLQQDKLLRVAGKTVTLLAADELRRLAAHDPLH